MHKKNIITRGKKIPGAKKALIMLHGRGGTAEDILGFAAHLNVDEYALFAPEATGNSWYPLSFLALPEQNEPWLSSAINLIKELVDDIIAQGIPANNIYFTGFSQGACLSLEFVARHATKYGGVAAFTGGLIGNKIYQENYSGDFKGTPVFIGSSDPDMHVPVERIHATTQILQNMHADVTEKIYKNMGHTINEDEIKHANRLIFN